MESCMSELNIFENSRFWKLLNSVLLLKEKRPCSEICEEFDVTESQLHAILNMLVKMDVHIEKELDNDELVSIGPAQAMPMVKFEMPLNVWLQFQAHFPLFSQCEEKPYHSTVKNQLAKIESDHYLFDIYQHIKNLDYAWSDKDPLETFATQLTASKELLGFIDECTLEGRSLNISFQSKKIKVFPWMVIHIEGKLCLVGELHSEKCLMYLPIDEMSAAFESEDKWKPNFTKMEVEEFIKGIRDIAGDEIRLILKLKSLANFDTKLIENNVNRPVMVVNSRGEHIWAGSVEPNEDVYKWVATLENNVEILDPEKFKLDFLAYCEKQLKKAA
jgi:hypothetical protein